MAAAEDPEPRAKAGGERSHRPSVSAFIDFFAYLGIAVLLVPIVLTCADIVWRRLIGGAFIDTFDITKLCLVAATSWSIPYGFIHATHVTVDIAVDRFPAKVQRGLDAAIHVTAALLIILLTWLAYRSAALHYAYHDTTPNLQLPVVYYWAVFLFGLVLTAVACLWRVWMALLGPSRPGGRS